MPLQSGTPRPSKNDNAFYPARTRDEWKRIGDPNGSCGAGRVSSLPRRSARQIVDAVTRLGINSYRFERRALRALQRRVDGLRERRVRYLSPAAVRELVFGQRHVSTDALLFARSGSQHTVVIADWPHTEYIKEREAGIRSDVYLEYLRASWAFLRPESNSEEERHAREEEFLALLDDVKSRCARGDVPIAEPIRVTRRPDGRIIVIHGNHRAAVANLLGLSLPVREVHLREHVREVATVQGEWYGADRADIPYQSIVWAQKDVVEGRRPDILRRMKMLRSEDLIGRTVMELGSNIGANCLVASQMGCTDALGLEMSPRLVTAAIRLNGVFAQNCHFTVHDLHQPLPQGLSADTVLCFSVFAHLRDTAPAVDAILSATKRVLYFEAHSGERLGNYEYFLNRNNFSSIECIGFGAAGTHSRSWDRPLFRCVIRDGLS